MELVRATVYETPQPMDPASFLRALGAPHTARSYPPRCAIFAQGDPCDAVFYLQHGRVKRSLLSPRGKEAVIAIYGAGDFFGEVCLSGKATRIATATTIAPSSIVRIEKEVMLRALREEPRFTQMFIAHLLARNIRIEEDLADHLFNSGEKRLARALLLLANFGKEDRPDAVIANISQETLAEMIGTTRPRVSFFMNRFRRLGFIEYKDGIRVYSSLLNVVLDD